MKNSPHIAVITNLSPNHLDIHKSMEEYIDAKKNIYKYQINSGRTILNYDNPITRSFIPEINGKLALFSILQECETGAHLYQIVFYRENKVERNYAYCQIKHRMTMLRICLAIVIAKVSIKSIVSVAKTFRIGT